MLSVETITTFTIASLVLCLAPGPDNIFVLTHSALHGARSGIMVTLGLCTGLLVHTSAVALGVAAILQTSVVAFTLLKIAGAGYLLYLAWLAFRAGPQQLGDAVSLPPGALYRRGIIMNVTNPKVSIFFLAFLPQFIDTQSGRVTLQVFLLGTVFILCTILVFGGVALLSGQLGRLLQRNTRIQMLGNKLAGAIFVLLALRIAFAGIN